MPETTPKLPTTAEASDYAPYSFLAVMAIGTAVLFAVILIVLIIGAWMSGQPLHEPKLLILAFLAAVLAFAARRQIKNSEGTRVGLPFCNAAWMIAVVGGMVYSAYLFARSQSVSGNASEAFLVWATPLTEANPVDLKNVKLLTAFHGTLQPDKQSTIAPNDAVRLQQLFRNQIVAFRQSDLVRLLARNGADAKFEILGLEDWSNDRNGALSCKLTVKVTSPEGEHTMSVPMQRVTIKGKPEPVWQVQPPQNEATMFFHSQRVNNYGERIRDMELAAQQLVYSNFLEAFAARGSHMKNFEAFSNTAGDRSIKNLANEVSYRAALASGLAWIFPDPRDNLEVLTKTYFQPTETGDPTREESQRRQFIQACRQGFIAVPGQVLSRSPDVGIVLRKTPEGWEARVPVEIQANAGQGPTAARGVVVCRADDAAFIKELDGLKAQPGEIHDWKARMGPNAPVPWKVVRIESDMKLETAQRPQGPE